MFKRNIKQIVKRWIGFAIISFITLILVEFTIRIPLSLAKFNVAQNMFEQYNFIDAYFTINKEGQKNFEKINNDIVTGKTLYSKILNAPVWPPNYLLIPNAVDNDDDTMDERMSNISYGSIMREVKRKLYRTVFSVRIPINVVYENNEIIISTKDDN